MSDHRNDRRLSHPEMIESRLTLSFAPQMAFHLHHGHNLVIRGGVDLQNLE